MSSNTDTQPGEILESPDRNSFEEHEKWAQLKTSEKIFSKFFS